MKIKSFLLPGIFFLLSSCLILYVFYKSQIIHNGNKFDYYKPYYYFAFFLLFCSLISFFLSKNLIFNLTLTSISIIFASYFVEGYFHYVEVSDKKNTNPMTANERVKFYEEARQNEGVNTIPIPPQVFLGNIDNLDLVPLSGHSNNKNFYCAKGQYIVLNHDRYGFNNPDSEWDKSSIDYFIVGDSNIYGACVKEEQNINGYLRKLSKKTVLNIGQMGNGPLLEYATLKEYFKKDKTKRVVWVYYENNDLANLIFERRIPLLEKYYNNKDFTQNLIFKQQKINEIIINKTESMYQNMVSNPERDIKKFEPIKFIKLYFTRQFIVNLLFKEEYPVNYLIDIINKTRNLVEENNTNFYFVYLPDHYRYQTNQNEKYMMYDKIIKNLSEKNILVIDLHKEVFSKINALDYMDKNDSGYNHYNEKGNLVIAETIIKIINEYEKKF